MTSSLSRGDPLDDFNRLVSDVFIYSRSLIVLVIIRAAEKKHAAKTKESLHCSRLQDC